MIHLPKIINNAENDSIKQAVINLRENRAWRESMRKMSERRREKV